MKDRKNNLSTNYLNAQQIENICNVLTDIYTEDKLRESGTIISQIDIEDFVTHYLNCKIVYETIDDEQVDEKDVDCMGVISDGIRPISVIRDGKSVKIIFPANTIILDKYLTGPKQANHKRFVIAHEAGHIIKNRMYGTVSTEYNHAGGVVLTSASAIHKRYSYKEVEANNFAASLLIPEGMVAMWMHKLYGEEKIVKYQDDILDGKDIDNIKFLAKTFAVSNIAMYIRLLRLGYITEGALDSYVEETVLGDKHDN